jgi:uncharacterized membrane protein
MVHPHPASVHFPIAFLALACGLDVLQVASGTFNVVDVKHVASAQEIMKAAHYAQLLGLITAVPATATGSLDGIKSVLAQGLYDSQTKQLKPKMKTLMIHTLVTTAASLVHLSIYFARERAQLSSASLGQLEPTLVAVEAIFTLLMFFGAKLGGELAFKFGMGTGKQQVKKKSG